MIQKQTSSITPENSQNARDTASKNREILISPLPDS